MLTPLEHRSSELHVEQVSISAKTKTRQIGASPTLPVRCGGFAPVVQKDRARARTQVLGRGRIGNGFTQARGRLGLSPFQALMEPRTAIASRNCLLVRSAPGSPTVTSGALPSANQARKAKDKDEWPPRCSAGLSLPCLPPTHSRATPDRWPNNSVLPGHIRAPRGISWLYCRTPLGLRARAQSMAAASAWPFRRAHRKSTRPSACSWACHGTRRTAAPLAEVRDHPPEKSPCARAAPWQAEASPAF